jgi:hypothetical protein
MAGDAKATAAAASAENKTLRRFSVTMARSAEMGCASLQIRGQISHYFLGGAEQAIGFTP